jgi:hypothetical protein
MTGELGSHMLRRQGLSPAYERLGLDHCDADAPKTERHPLGCPQR